jgi:hypothetical protein
MHFPQKTIAYEVFIPRSNRAEGMGVELMLNSIACRVFSCLHGDLAVLPHAKKVHHYNTMHCLRIRHALILPYYLHYERANKAHEGKTSAELLGVFQYWGHYHITGAFTTPRHACFSSIQKQEAVLQ